MTNDISYEPIAEASEPTFTPQQAQANALQALAIIEQLETSIDQLKNLAKHVDSEHISEYNSALARLTSAYGVLNTDSLATNLPVLESGLLKNVVNECKIERLGLASEIIRLRQQQRMPVSRIAAQFGISERAIVKFFNYYDSCKPSEKAKLRRKSIFQSTERMEDLTAIIYRQLARLEGVNDDIAVRYTAELRNTIELAIKMTEKIANYQKFQELVQAVHDILADELPQKRRRILGRIGKVTGSLGLDTRAANYEENLSFQSPPLPLEAHTNVWDAPALES